jgi:predicted ester cyclase
MSSIDARLPATERFCFARAAEVAHGKATLQTAPGYWVGMSPQNQGRDDFVAGLVRVGELELTGEDEARVDAYFAPDFAFHGPDGAEMDHEGLKGYFASLRAAFDDLTISRGITIVEGDYVACQTTIEGTFVREFTHSPIGPLPPNGRRVVFELMNIFRYDDQGRLAEEWVQTDNRSRLRQLGAQGR